MAIPPPIVPPFYPNVPAAPGVPALNRQPGAIFGSVVLLAADAALIYRLISQKPQWGIYLDGQPAITATSIVSFDFRQDWRISSAQQEQGSFLSYNKVQDPFEGKLTFVQGGTDADRAAFLSQVMTALGSLGLYSLVMPEFTYPSVNVVHYEFRRTARAGRTLLAVDVWVEQVRVAGAAQFSNTANPASAAPTNNGGTQPQAPTATQSTAISPPK